MSEPLSPYTGLEPASVWEHFQSLNAIPRPSGQEAAAREHVERLAAEHGADAVVDGFGNVIVRVPASSGREGTPSAALQAHLDMVCERRPDVQHDFTRNPIRPRRDGDYIYGTGTTLGADNGIGIAMMLAAMTDPSVQHGPLELVMTVQEETGLHGSMALDGSLIQSRLLINLDSEDPKELTVGCAGGAGAILRLKMERAPAAEGWKALEIGVSGLKGGHSGVQIHEPLANATKLLVHALNALTSAGVDYRLASLQGGTAHNAIPRDASAVISVDAGSVEEVIRVVASVREELRGQWSVSEPGVELGVRPAEPQAVFSAEDGKRLIDLLTALPHGVLRMSTHFPGKVETSSNLATVRAGEGGVEIATSSRSFIASELDAVQGRITELGRGAGAHIEIRDGYPGWEPILGSELQHLTERVYERLFGAPPAVEVIHAGLECGVIVSKVPGMQAISFGPLIEGAHSPDERVSIPTVATSWQLLCGVLAELA